MAFLEEERELKGWEIQPLISKNGDPCRRAKQPKMLPHQYFPEADYSVWIDGCISIISQMPLRNFIQDCLSLHHLAVFRHRKRSCVYKEAEACIAAKKDDPFIIRKQMSKYEQEGFPSEGGLAECCVVVRRHTPISQAFNIRWNEEVTAFSRRDQLSFNYVALKLGMTFGNLPGLISRNPHFKRYPHTNMLGMESSCGVSLLRGDTCLV